jgi:RNA polymerase sigma-70 factor (ECF subfamily)
MRSVLHVLEPQASPTPTTTNAAREAKIQALCRAGDVRQAVTRAVELYGAELTGFLTATLDRRDGVADVYAEVCELLCVELAGFEWRSSLRTWMYAVARHARLRHEERRRSSESRQVPISRAPEVPAPPPSRVPDDQRTTMKEQLARARELLATEERELLVLRGDRGWPWTEIASVLGSPAEEVGRSSAALRKRFERTLEKLRRIFDERVAASRAT